MKKLFSMLSLAAIVASALFVSCAQKKDPTLVPAFPYHKTATYALNKKGAWTWSYATEDLYEAAKGGGFQSSKLGTDFLEYRMTPNADWTLEVVGEGKEYVEAYNQDGYLSVEELTFAHHLSGLKGMNEVGFRVIKTPAFGEEPVEVEVALSMAGETMVILTLVIEAAAE